MGSYQREWSDKIEKYHFCFSVVKVIVETKTPPRVCSLLAG